MKNWKINGDGTVTLEFDKDSDLVVSEHDFNRAFGAMVNACHDEIEREFAINAKHK